VVKYDFIREISIWQENFTSSIELVDHIVQVVESIFIVGLHMSKSCGRWGEQE
jgi:hypothetical protein